MGVFVTKTARPSAVVGQLAAAYQAPQHSPEEASQLAQQAATAPLAADTEFHTGRFLGALAIFAALLALAVLADAESWVSDTSALYGMATTVLGVIVGLLGGENAGTASAG
jgi:hypothetical protein